MDIRNYYLRAKEIVTPYFYLVKKEPDYEEVLFFLAVLSILEYRPAEVEYLTVENRAEKTQKVEPGKEMTLQCWNIGYGGLGKEMDFFMDGRTKVGPLPMIYLFSPVDLLTRPIIRKF